MGCFWFIKGRGIYGERERKEGEKEKDKKWRGEREGQKR